MCGIFCLLSSAYGEDNSATLLSEFKPFENLIIRRGPNSFRSEYYSAKNYNILLAASVLWLQGPDITAQPLKNKHSILNYNGDVFGGSEIDEDLKFQVGDTELLFESLRSAESIVESLSAVEGPYAFIYLDIDKNVLYFGRDHYGRRSLLIGGSSNRFIVTSVARRNTKFDFKELPCIGIFSINLNNKQWQIFPWRSSKNVAEKLEEMRTFLGIEISVGEVKRKEIINYKFTPPSEAYLDMLKNLTNYSSFDILENFSLFRDNVMKLKELLKDSVKKRILTQPKFCKNCFKDSRCNHAITGILFSGGVDCTILALLADSFVGDRHPIDLINVAFEKEGTFNTPDRSTSVASLQELRTLCPRREWNFVEVNVTREELDSCRSKSISDLIYPLNSILDDSLGCALWFAARAETETYTSPCRTLLVGMGADELFGGYTRHRAALQKKGWEGLHSALEEDWQNLPHRNLARDDRVVSDHGRQLRTPYLDEQVVRFARSLHCWEKTTPTTYLPRGVGEKILLRGLAYHLGLREAAVLQKRALQFGSRIANSKEKGHAISEKLLE